MRKSRSHGILAMSPANPSGTMIGREALAELGETCRRLGLWFVSDEIYHGLTYGEPASTALVVRRRCGRDQLVLQILLHDRLAHRLDGGAGAAGAAHRAAGAEPLHLAALPLAGGGARRLRRDRGAGGGQGGLCPQPRAISWRSCRRIGITEMHPVDGAFYIYADIARFTNDSIGFSQAHAGGGRRRGNAGPRFRSHRRLALPAPVLRRLGERLPRDGGAAEGVVEVGVQSLPDDRHLRGRRTGRRG